MAPPHLRVVGAPIPACDFLRLFRGDQPWQLGAINRVTKDPKWRAFPAIDTRDADALAWAAQWNADKYDIYFCINPTRQPIHSKPAKEDIAAAEWLASDLDPPGDLPPEDLDVWRAGKMVEIREKPGPAPTLIVDSGRGFWLFWRLAEPAQVDGRGPLTAAVESYAKGIGAVYGADACFNIDRIARLPGFVNHKTGRQAVVLSHEAERAYPLQSFPSAPVRQKDAEAASVRPELVDDEAARQAAVEMLKKAPPGIEKAGGRKLALDLYQRCGDLGCSHDVTLDLMDAHWSDRCLPVWEREEMEHELRSLRRNDPIGVLHPVFRAEREKAKLEGFFEQPAPPPGLETFTLAELAGLPVPPQRWLVKDFIPYGTVTMLGGDGSTGKSLLALQLAESITLGREWIGLATCVQGPVLFVSAEDEKDELHRRSARIHPRLEELSGVSVCVLAGDDAVLALPVGRDGKVLRPTLLFEKLLTTVQALRPALVVLDTLADLFGGDENQKLHARQFVGLLVKLARDWETTVLLLYHPSESGMASGTGKSGNTAWNNSVRSRLYLEASKEDRDVRHLETKKANRAARGEKLSVRWVSGRFLREGALVSASRSEIENDADRVFMKLLTQLEKEGRPVSPAPNAGNNAAKVFSEHASSEGVGRVHFARALDRLLANGIVKVETYGPPSRQQSRITRTGCPLEGDLKVEEKDLFSGLS